MERLERPRYPSEMKECFMVRLPDGTRDQVREMAEKNHRSMNSQFVFLIQAAIVKEKQNAEH